MTYLPENKKCHKCGKIKNKNEFDLNTRSPDGLFSQCKKCKKIWTKQSNQNYQLQKRYGITEIDYEIMLKSQNRVCAICKQPEIKKRNRILCRLSIDHNHKTSKVRGLLCHKCNIMLGHIENNPGLLKEVLKYLKGE